MVATAGRAGAIQRSVKPCGKVLIPTRQTVRGGDSLLNSPTLPAYLDLLSIFVPATGLYQLMQGAIGGSAPLYGQPKKKQQPLDAFELYSPNAGGKSLYQPSEESDAGIKVGGQDSEEKGAQDSLNQANVEKDEKGEKEKSGPVSGEETPIEDDGAKHLVEQTGDLTKKGTTDKDDEGVPSEKDGKNAPTVTVGGSGDSEDIAAWKAKVDGATKATPQPELVANTTEVADAGKNVAGKRRQAGGTLAADAKKAIRKPPETPKALKPPPPTPVPAADKLIADASDKKLRDQTLPMLEQRPPDASVPKPTMPVIALDVAADLASRIEVPGAEPGADAASGDKKPLDAEQLDKLKEAKAKQPEENRKGKPGQQMVLSDTASPPAPSVEIGTKGQGKEKVALVLAELLRSPDPKQAAKEMVDEARGEAFPRNALNELRPEFGASKKDDLIVELRAQIDSIRVMAGITAEELDAAMKSRAETLKALESGAKEQIKAAASGAKEETKASGEGMAGDIAGARDAVDETVLQQTIAANGEADPAVIEQRRDKAMLDLTRRTARQDLFYEKSGERRSRALESAWQAMREAYKNAATEDRKQVHDRMRAEQKKAKKPAVESDIAAKAEYVAAPIFAWTAKRTTALDREFAALKEEAATAIKRFRNGIKQALVEAKQMLRDWAEEKISDQESLWDWLVRKYRDWMKEAKDDSAAWEEARSEKLRDELVGDLQMLEDVEAAANSGVDVQTYLEKRNLDQTQMGILKTYYAGVGPKGKKKKRDAIGAVAEGMRNRIRTARKPVLLEWFKTEVMNLPDSEYKLMGELGNIEKPPFQVVELASDLYEAMDQWGTDEDKIFRTLAGLTPLQARALRARYRDEYGSSLDSDLASEMGGAEITRAKALLEGNQTLADVATLYEAMHGGLTGAGTDEDAIMLVLRNKSPDERAAIVAEYKKRYKKDLEADLKGELDDGWSGPHDYQRASALMKGNVRKADAIALDAATRGGLTADEAEITRIYEQNRAEVEAEAASKGWSTAEMNEQIKLRNQGIETEYENVFGDPGKTDGQPSALRLAFGARLSDAELGLANALADGDMTAIDSAKLGVEKESFITGDEAVNTILESQHKRARKDVERDVNLDLQLRAEADALSGNKWGPARWKTERATANQVIETKAREVGMANMDKLQIAFDRDWGGVGGLTGMIAKNMIGEDQLKAVDLLNQGGYLAPEQEIFYAVNGAGTDVDKLKEVLKGKSPAQVGEIRKAWVARYGGTEAAFNARILEEVGGNDHQEMQWALAGEPEDLDGQLKRAAEKKKYYKEARGAWGDYAREEADMEEQYQALAAKKKRLDELKHLNEPQKKGEKDDDYAARLDRYAFWEESFKLQKSSLDRSIEDHEAAVNAFADTAAMIAGIVAVIVVMVVVGIATGGTGAVAIGAALASAKVAAAGAIAAAVATIGTKALIKGKAYSHEEMAVDAIVGAVDAVASAMTAGVGGGLLKAARAGAPASRLAGLAAKSKLAGGLARMAKSDRMAARMFAGAVSEGLEGVVSSVPSALAGNLVEEQNWVHGNPLANIVKGTVIQTGMGAVVGGGMGAFGGISKHVEPPRATGDILAKRGRPTDRLPLWKAWKTENPGKPYKQFLDQLDSGILASEADDAAVKAMRREMRGELLSGIPPAQRGQFADVPIHVVSDADFERFARSSSGQAVLIFKDGKPAVIMRESADIKALREEGIHLVQSTDPKLAKKFAALDERKLAHWDQLGLDDKLALYRTKLDIELDGQARLIKGLDDQLAAVDDPALRKSLQARRDAAAKNLDNLEKRLDEVDGLAPADRLKMARGKMAKPQYLDQKPRLFSKKDDVAKAKAALEGRRARRTAGHELKAKAVKALGGDRKTIASLEAVWKIYSKRTDTYLRRLGILIAGGRPFDHLFDATKALKSFGKALEQLADPTDIGRLVEFLAATRHFLAKVKLGFKHFDPFVQLAPRFDSPRQLFNLVESLAALPSFRKGQLAVVANVLGKVADKKGSAAAAELAEKLRNLAALVKARDGIGRTKNLAKWQEAQDLFEAAAKDLRESARGFGLVQEDLAPIFKEMARSGRFDWKTFKLSLSQKHRLGKEPAGPLKDMIEEIKQAVLAKKQKWNDADVGPLLHWSPVFRELSGRLDKEGRAALVDRLKLALSESLPELTVGSYRKYRHALKHKVLDHLITIESPTKMLKMLDEFLRLAPETASKGEYLTAFRRKLFAPGSSHAAKGVLKHAKDVELDSRRLAGSMRMVDGAIELPPGTKISNGPRKGGIWLIDDKAGASEDWEQAIAYSVALGNKTLKTSRGTVGQGLIFMIRDPKHAAWYAEQLNLRGLHPNLLVATYGSNGMVFVQR